MWRLGVEGPSLTSALEALVEQLDQSRLPFSSAAKSCGADSADVLCMASREDWDLEQVLTASILASLSKLGVDLIIDIY
jgi:hypothetical protein